MKLEAIALQLNEVINTMREQQNDITKLQHAEKAARHDANESKTEIRALNRKYTALGHKFDAIEKIVDKKKGMSHLNEISKHMVQMSNITQLALIKLTVLTEINFISKNTFNLQRTLLVMFDDPECDALFKRSRTMDEWRFVINRYKKEVM